MSLTPEHVKKIAHLARLHISEAQVEDARTHLSSVLGYMERLAALDLADVEPMSHPGGTVNRLREDVPKPGLSPEALVAMAPQTLDNMVVIPKVIGDGGAA